MWSQGLGGAVVDVVALSLVVNLFTEPGERAKAMGVYGFVCAGGGGKGVLLGGVLISTLNWHWIFLVNLPIGIAVYALCLRLLPKDVAQPHKDGLAQRVPCWHSLSLSRREGPTRRYLCDFCASAMWLRMPF